MTFAWYFAGVTNAEIARRMNFLRAPTYSAMKQRSRRGYLSTAWSADTVKGIVHNPTYAGFATPGIYNKKKKLWGLNGMVAPDPEQLWNTTKVRNIIRRYEYTGAFAGGKTKVMTVGSKSVRKRPEN